MPEFMDVHTGMAGITSEGLLEAHNADLAIQDDEKVNFKHAGPDPETGMVVLPLRGTECRSGPG